MVAHFDGIVIELSLQPSLLWESDGVVYGGLVWCLSLTYCFTTFMSNATQLLLSQLALSHIPHTVSNYQPSSKLCVCMCVLSLETVPSDSNMVTSYI
jgi:hypothetical protein